ncbi:hypothetical protein BS78_05G028000 [Paspalum vaginatum]|nr:hypothetical protein BS78_05G028000 [Paspalum vaginatum]
MAELPGHAQAAAKGAAPPLGSNAAVGFGGGGGSQGFNSGFNPGYNPRFGGGRSYGGYQPHRGSFNTYRGGYGGHHNNFRGNFGHQDNRVSRQDWQPNNARSGANQARVQDVGCEQKQQVQHAGQGMPPNPAESGQINHSSITPGQGCVGKPPVPSGMGMSMAEQNSTPMEVDNLTRKSSKGVGKKNPYCYRCFTKKVMFQLAEHVTKTCPLMKGAKPTAIPCGYAVDGLGFYFIPHTEKHVPKSDSRSALVKVIEGSLTAAQVTVELERILPGNWKWTLEEINDKTFMTTFPSNVELQRLILWGPLEAKSSKGKLEISEGKDADVWKYEIPKSWIQFRGLPKELREFPIIWAIGSIFGVTRMVDMGFTKKCGRPRMKVAVLDPKLIPEYVNVVIGDYVYELQFWEDGDKGEENNPEKDNTSSKNIVGEEKSVGETQSNQPATDVLGSCSAPRASAHGMDCAIRPTVILKPSGKIVQGTKEWVAEIFNNEQLLSTVEKAGKQSLINEVTVPIHESGSTPLPMPEPAKTPNRKSKRSASTSDQDSIEKATKLKARKNLEESSLKVVWVLL